MTAGSQEIISYLPESGSNPYLRLLRTALSEQGVKISALPLPLTAAWLEQEQGERKALHFHWPSHYYTLESRAGTSELLARWIDHLKLARRLGYGIVWTAHNLLPHECDHRDLQTQGRLAMIRYATGLIAHCRFAAAEMRRQFSANDEITIIPHGYYQDVYERPSPKFEARKILGIAPDSFLYLNFGLLRRYKGILELIRAFRRVARPKDLLLIAGEPADASLIDQIQEAARGDGRVHLHARYIEERDVPLYFGAADIAALPYTKILTSGVTALAHTMGTPVIAPTPGCMRELVPAGTGVLYDPMQMDGLDQALIAARALDLDRASQKAMELTRRIRWRDLGAATAKVYRRACELAATSRQDFSIQSIEVAAGSRSKDGMSEIGIRRFFEEQIPEKIRERPQLRAAINGFYRFVFSDLEDASWTLDITDPGTRIRGEGHEADCTITLKSSDFLGLVENRLDPRLAFLRGDLKVTGDIQCALRLPLLFQA